MAHDPLLHFQADRIELVLASHKLPARVTGGTVTPRLVRFHLSTPLGVRVKQVTALAEELALSLGAPACRVFRHEGLLQVEVPRPDGQTVPLLPLCQKLAHNRRSTVPPITAVLGLDGQGVPLLLRFPSPNVAHVLIAGTTGSGKTALARSIVASLALFNSQRSLQLLLVDPKSRGLAPFAGLPHLLTPLISRPDDLLPALQRILTEMERRDAHARSEPHLLIVLDELADLLHTGGPDLQLAITRLTQRGREAGIHLLACTQKPTATAIGSLVKSNFPVRLVGAVPSPEDAKLASGLAATGAERLLGHGDFLLVAHGQSTRLQAAFLSEDQTRNLVAHLRSGARPLALPATGTDGPLPRQPLSLRLRRVK